MCVNRPGSKVAAELAVDDEEHVLVERGCDAGRVVVGRLEPCDVLHEIGAKEKRLARTEQSVESAQEAAALIAGQVADRRAEECEQPSPAFGEPPEVALEVADDTVYLDARVLGRDRGGRLAKRLLRDVEGHEAPKVAGLDHRVEEQPSLLGRAGSGL